MKQELWRLDALQLARLIRTRDTTAREATASVLERIAEVNPRVNALTDVHAESSLAAAEGADKALARGEAVGPLHGVPVTIKINVDVAGQPTTGGIAASRDLIAQEDAPLVAHLRRAGAVIVGRNNAPAFSLRWFTDNDLHGRTLNPWSDRVTPGGSSGGAAAAAALGMGPIHHGNDYGGSVRYPAWACGVVGLRPTVGRVPAHNASSREERLLTNQLMSVNGPLARTVADARLAFHVMAQEDPRDPLWVPAPHVYPSRRGPLKVALFREWNGCGTDPAVGAALERAARWLADAGYLVEEAQPPHFEEAAVLWRKLLNDDLRRGAKGAIETYGDEAVKTAFGFQLAQPASVDRDGYLSALQRRLAIGRAWSLFLAEYAVLLMPVSWERPFAIDEDRLSQARMNAMIAAQSPLLATAMLGLPGLSVPTGVDDGIPAGVHLCATRYREDLCFSAADVIERAASFDPLRYLAPA